MKAPQFSLQDTEENTITLPKKGKVIVYFYPKAGTSGCTLEGNTFTDLYPQFIEQGTLVMGISPDPLKAVCKFDEKEGFAHTMLADPEHKVVEKYGVWVEKSMYGKKYMGVQRSTFLIVDGKIVQKWDKHKPGKTEQEILDVVKEL